MALQKEITMADVLFPIKKHGGKWSIYQRYYHMSPVPDMHFKYILNMMKYGGLNVSVSFDPETSPNFKYITSPPLDNSTAKNKFEIRFFGKEVLIDITDIFAETTTPDIAKHFDSVFTTHWNENLHKSIGNVYPLSVINFTDWNLFKRMKQQINYHPNPNKLILNNQRPMGDKWRRAKAQKLITTKYKTQCSVEFYKDQKQFFLNINNALVYVHVPGCRPDVLDRAQTQMFGLGMCTISPKYDETFAHYAKIVEWEHYVPCRENLDDLEEKIEWCKSNTTKCKEIGDNAKNFFDEHCHPSKLVPWMKTCLNV